MGSGHFLVSLVDYLADEVLLAITEAPAAVAWADPDAPYRSPLARRIEQLRERIRAEAAANGWPVREDQLDDRHLVRRIILKRVIYGVDLNPMAVELAKLSLWLHSFTVGAPLSFLDHHLRCGDSPVRRVRGAGRGGFARALRPRHEPGRRARPAVGRRHGDGGGAGGRRPRRGPQQRGGVPGRRGGDG